MSESRQSKIFYGYVVVLAAFLIMGLMWGTVYTFGIFLKPLLIEFGWTRAMTSGAFALSLLLYGLSGVVTGRLTDRFGSRVVVTVCGICFGLGYLLVSQVNTIWQLYLFYGVMVGIGLSGSFVPLVSTVAGWFVKRRGMMTGIATSGIGIGLMIIPLIANWLIASYSWRNSFIIVGVTVLVLVTLAAQLLRSDPGHAGQLSYFGSASTGQSYSNAPRFSLQESLRTWQFWMLGGALLCYGASTEVIMVHIVPHATDLEIPPASAAVILTIIGGISTGSRIIMGGVADKIGNKLAFSTSFVLMAVPLFWLLFSGKLWIFYFFAVIFGFGYGGISALLSPIVVEQFGLSSHGVILGALMIGCTVGEAIGPVLAGHIFDIMSDYSLAFLIHGIACVIGFVLISLLKPARKEARTSES
ncbi:MFS transporter [Chloroflexota bacterium]